MLVLAVVTVYGLITSHKGEENKPSFSNFMEDVYSNPGHIKSVRIEGQNYHVEYQHASDKDNPPHNKVTVVGPPEIASSHVLAALDKAKIRYELEKRDEGGWLTLLLGSWLPMLAMVFFFFVVMRQLQA